MIFNEDKLSCFDDFLTYRESDIIPTSGLYVNDLYGVNLTKMDAVANTDYASGIAFINSKIIMAIRYISTELKRYVMPYFKLNSVIGHYKGGEFDDNLQYHIASNAERGLRIDIKETVLSQIIVNRVRVLLNSPAATYNIVIEDGEHKEYISFVYAAIRTEQDVEINYAANRDRIYIYINNNDDPPIPVNLKPAKGSANMNCCGEDYNILSVTGWTGTGVSSHHYGIMADVSVICNPIDLFCLMKEYLSFATLYRFGIELANETLETNRFNYFSMVTRDDIKDLRVSYMEDYEKEMAAVARTMPVLLRKLDDYCIDCNQNKYVEQTP